MEFARTVTEGSSLHNTFCSSAIQTLKMRSGTRLGEFARLKIIDLRTNA
jgi:hypothetical protein